MKIKMFDGMIRTFGGVVYVPKMRRNIIVLGLLDSMCCRYSAVCGNHENHTQLFGFDEGRKV